MECSELVVKWSKMWKVQNDVQCEEFLSGEPSAQILNLNSIHPIKVLKWDNEIMPLMKVNVIGESSDSGFLSCLI